jgi:hypothetical protein
MTRARARVWMQSALRVEFWLAFIGCVEGACVSFFIFIFFWF